MLFRPNIEKLEQSGDADGLAKVLERKKNTPVADEAALALARLGDPRAVEHLIWMLHQAISERNEYKTRLDKIRSSNPGARVVREANPERERELSDAYRSAKERVGAAVATLAAFAKRGDRVAIAGLVEVSHYPWNEPVDAALTEARSLSALVAALGSEQAHTRAWAVRALGDLGDPGAVEPLITALSDQDAEVRAGAAGALGGLGGDRAIGALITGLSDQDASVQTSAAHALGGLGEARAIEALIEALGDDSLRAVHPAAISALRGHGDQRAVEPLIGLLESPELEVRLRAVPALGELGDERAVEPLILTFTSDEDHPVRSDAREALVAIWRAASADGDRP